MDLCICSVQKNVAADTKSDKFIVSADSIIREYQTQIAITKLNSVGSNHVTNMRVPKNPHIVGI